MNRSGNRTCVCGQLQTKLFLTSFEIWIYHLPFTIFPALGGQLFGLICAISDEIDEITPTWTLKRTNGKIFLDIEWKFKWPTFPATGTADRPHDCAGKQNPQHWNRQLDNESKNNYTTSAPGPVSFQKTGKKKRKSPSTLKSDKRRRDTWLASIKGKSNGQNRQDSNDPVLLPIHTNDSNSIMEKLPID